MRKFFFGLLMLVFVVMLSSATVAQPGDVVAADLNAPRGLTFDTDGNLYIAEAGSGGPIEIGEIDHFGQPITAGATSQVTMVTPDGNQTVLMPALPSFGGDPLGVQNLLVTDDLIWLVFSEGLQSMPLTTAVIAVDRETFRMRHFIDLYTYEHENNPDGTDEIYSNPNDIAIAPDGTLYIVDTGANTIYTWTPEDGLEVFVTWGTNPVPTGISFNDDGEMWVSFLGQGIAPGAGSLQRLGADGEMLQEIAGLTGVTDVLVADDGTVYFVEFVSFGDDGPMDLQPGRVGRVTADGEETVQAELMFPYALAQAPDGSLYVSMGSVFTPPGDGVVLRLNVD